MIGADTRAILIPNLTGNAPDWDVIRKIADRHRLTVIEDSCDALGARLRGTPTGTRSDISVTSFALAHIITCAGNGGMVLLDDEALWTGACCFVAGAGGPSCSCSAASKVTGTSGKSRRHAVRQHVHLRRIGLNFEPSELGAAFGLSS